MPLEILGPLVLIGIISAGLFVRLVANAPARLIQDSIQARSIFSKDYPSTDFGPSVLISKDERDAILELKQPDGHIGFVHVMGSKHLTRCINQSDIRSVLVENECDLVIRFKDFTLPKVSLAFQTSRQCQEAMTLVEKIKVPNHA